MLKQILQLDGIHKLNKKQQLSIQGGLEECIHPGTNQCRSYGFHCAELECRILDNLNRY
ncbi:hypothetical protein [Aquimarina sp. RZ0]|uniref:hypothetical protein n=1 Tax=Aquimarina sp. RZ0 TaxID=2607730 RepID=UPI00165F0EDF|nr:hypothetical protein [Aquimarina sp. RZ0]